MAIKMAAKPGEVTVIRTTMPLPKVVHAESKPAVDRVIVGRKVVGRPSSGKIRVTLLLDPAVIQRFKATGPGWQARINDALKTAKIP